MNRSFALLHTVPGLVPAFAELAARHLPGWTPFNIVDESLLRNTIRENALTSATMRRVAGHIWSAVDAGAEAVMVTCSSIGPAVDAARPFCPVPVVRVDVGMVDAALKQGDRIGVLATLATTLAPTQALVVDRAAALAVHVQVTARLCDGAFDLLAAGDRDGHDAAVANGIAALAAEVDVIVLAQASMARALSAERLSRLTVPVLASPELGIRHFAGVLAERGA